MILNPALFYSSADNGLIVSDGNSPAGSNDSSQIREAYSPTVKITSAGHQVFLPQ